VFRVQKRLAALHETEVTEDIIRQVAMFDKLSLSVLEHFKAKQILTTIDVTELTVEQVLEAVKAVSEKVAEPALVIDTSILDTPPLEGKEIVFVLGGPGSGKGTQCARIVEEFGHTHLSTGDLLRDEVASGSPLGTACQTLMTEGKLVSQEIIISLLKAAMVKSDGTKFLIDGFPRAMDQAEMFEAKVAVCDKVLFFDCPLETMTERLLKRGETSGRADDNLETIQKRFDTFTSQSLPVVTHFEAQNKCFKISSIPGPDEVYPVVKAALEAETTEVAIAHFNELYNNTGAEASEPAEAAAPEPGEAEAAAA
jgi:adenylate kinase